MPWLFRTRFCMLSSIVHGGIRDAPRDLRSYSSWVYTERFIWFQSDKSRICKLSLLKCKIMLCLCSAYSTCVLYSFWYLHLYDFILQTLSKTTQIIKKKRPCFVVQRSFPSTNIIIWCEYQRIAVNISEYQCKYQYTAEYVETGRERRTQTQRTLRLALL